ncbi:unnamed protein product [Amaranthus hypochondriacus]
MGNSSTKQKKPNKSIPKFPSSNQIQIPRKKPPSLPLVFLFGDPKSSSTSYLRFALLYKPLTLRFVPSDSPEFRVRFETEDEPVSGPIDTILEHVESKLPFPPLLKRERKKLLEWLGGDDETTPWWEVVKMVVLQHRSMRSHLERIATWGMDLATRGGSKVVDLGVGTPKMEVTKLGKSYGDLLEVLLEHAQMEERLIFPFLQSNDPGVCRVVNEEHARDLPIMNGIKEDIKSVGVNLGKSTHKEAFHSLSTRLKTLQKNCNQHFDEEEKNLLPLMEASNLSENQQRKIINQCIDVMQGTHSHLFRFFIEGLLPHESMEYLDVIGSCIDKEKLASLLHLLVE